MNKTPKFVPFIGLISINVTKVISKSSVEVTCIAQIIEFRLVTERAYVVKLGEFVY